LPDRYPQARRTLTEEKSKILLVEDDFDVAEMLNGFFRAQGYNVFIANWGEDGVRAAAANRPDLIILDIRLPDIDGYEVARRLRLDRKTSNIPIIFLTEKKDRADRLRGLELGADDYISKPFDVQELRLRVKNCIRRANQESLTNAVTGLPEGDFVTKKLTECLTKNSWGLVYVGLKNLDGFRDEFGFVASDDVLRAVSLMLEDAVSDAGTSDDILGHLSPIDFVIRTESAAAVLLAERARSRIEQSIEKFYPMNLGQDVVKGKRLGVQTAHLVSGERRLNSQDEILAELMLRKK